MKQICVPRLCTGCAACANVCPKGCITLTYDENGFLQPSISDGCIDCGRCQKVCPAINDISLNDIDEVYTAHSNDEQILCASTSGGMFTMLSKAVLEKGGAVFGAKMSEDFSCVYHDCAKNAEELKWLRGTKYIQSETRIAFRSAKTLLNDGKQVIYFGTPCQIAGLRSYLGKEYENLYTVDFVCHGVASTRVYREHIEAMNMKSDDICTVMFRNKKHGYFISTLEDLKTIGDGKRHSERLSDSSFKFAFANNLLSRESCSTCKYAVRRRASDITVADYIGPDASDYEKENGVSLILVNTDKGKELFDSIKPQISFREMEKEKVVARIAHLNAPSSPHKNRNLLFAKMKTHGYKYAAEKYFCVYVPKLTIRRLISALRNRLKRLTRGI